MIGRGKLFLNSRVEESLRYIAITRASGFRLSLFNFFFFIFTETTMSLRVPPSLAMLALVIALAVGAASLYDNDWDTSCYWTDYVNDFDEPVSSMCSADYAISGIQSYHSNRHEDRRTRFKCCKQQGYKTYSCALTSYLNNYDATLNYNVPQGKVLAGWFSIHSNRKEDRRHKMLVCSYGKLVPPS